MSARPAVNVGTLWVSLLAALTTWVTLLAWAGFAEQPFGYLGPLAGACLLVAVLGTLLRMTRLPAVGVAAVQALVVVVWLQQGYGGVRMTAAPLPVCEVAVDQAYDGAGDAFECVNPGFFDAPVAERTFDLRDRL